MGMFDQKKTIDPETQQYIEAGKQFIQSRMDKGEYSPSQLLFRQISPLTDDDYVEIGRKQSEKQAESRSTLGAFTRGALRLPENIAAKTITAIQGQTGASVADRGIADRFVNWVEDRNRRLAKEYEGTGDFIPGVVSKKDVAELFPNLAFSGISMGGTIAGGAVTAPIPVPGARIAGGLAGGAAAAYRMDAYQVMNDWLKKVNQESIDKGLGPISKAEEDKFKEEMSSLVTEHAAWEAGPEGIGNMLELALMVAKNLPGVRWLPKGITGKVAKGALRFGGVLGSEEATETITQMGQQITEAKAGMTAEAPREWTSGGDILKSAKEVFPQVLLLSGFMGAGGATYRGAAAKGTEKRKDNIISMVDEGMTTGEIAGEPFTPEDALEVIKNAYKNKTLTNENIDQFKEQHPDLRPGLNVIISEDIKTKLAKEIGDAESAARQIEEKGVKRQADLLDIRQRKAEEAKKAEGEGIRAVEPPEAPPIRPAPEQIYKPRGLKEAQQIRKEMGSLEGYDTQSKTEWLGNKTPPKDGKLTLYRATPEGEVIKPGDYVTNELEYAKAHIEANLGGKGKITEVEATLDDIFPADGPKEFWYAPKSIEAKEKPIPEAPPVVGKEITPVEPKPTVEPDMASINEALKKRKVIGDDLLNTQDRIEELAGKNAEFDKHGNITLYHRTTPENAAKIIKAQKMLGKEDRLFFGTTPTGQIEGYGKSVVKVQLPIEDVRINDIFRDEAHLTLKVGKLGKVIDIKAEDIKKPIPTPVKEPVVEPRAAEEVTKALTKEARKYKTAVEFAESQKLYHGTSEYAEQEIKKKGFLLSSEHHGYANTVENYISLTKDKKVAQEFAEATGMNVDKIKGGKGVILEIDKRKLKIADGNKIPEEPNEPWLDYIDRLKKEGYDAVDISKVEGYEGEGEVALFNYKKVKLFDEISTKELKSFWELAQKKPTEAKEKQPWEMRKIEFADWYEAQWRKEYGKEMPVSETLTPAREHEYKVKQAIAEGKIASHPDYPELAKLEKPVAEPKARIVPEKPVAEYLYHGTLSKFKDFDRGKDIGIHFGTKEQAKDRLAFKTGGEKEGRIVEAIIDLKKPLYLEDDANNWSNPDMVLNVLKRAVEEAPVDFYNFTLKDLSQLKSIDEIRTFLQKKGYDGIVYRNYGEAKRLHEGATEKEIEKEMEENYSTIVFDTAQIETKPTTKAKTMPEKVAEKYRIEPYAGTQVGYEKPGRKGAMDRTRKVKGFMVIDAEGYERFFNTKKKAQGWVESEGGQVIEAKPPKDVTLSALGTGEIVNTLKSFKADYAKAKPYLIELGQRTYSKTQKAGDWMRQMRSQLGDMWDTFRNKMREIWDASKKWYKESKLGEERGLIGGEKAVGAPKGVLAKAEKMLAEGKTEKEVWNATGWTKEASGKWAWRIDDSGAKLKDRKEWLEGVNYPYETGVEGFGIKLGDIIEHDTLFNAYPQLKNIRVGIGHKSEGEASYDESSNIIHIGEDELAIPASEGWEDNIKKILLHEVSHAIQEIEGFARGGSPEQFKVSSELVTSWGESTDEAKDALDLLKLMKLKRISLIGARREFKIINDRDVKGSAAFLAKNSPKEDIQQQYNYSYRKLDELITGEIEAPNKYRHLAGEIYAREEAAGFKGLPGTMEGIPRDQWIVKDGEGTSFSIETTKGYKERDYKKLLKAYQKDVAKRAKVKTDSISKVALDQKTKQGITTTQEITDSPGSPEGFNLPSEGRGRQVLDTIQWKMQDRLIHLRKVQTAIETEKAIELPDSSNVYQTEELYHYKTTKRINDADRALFDPLIESIHKSKYDLEDVELFLRARHAEEANARLQEINPKREDNAALSGMSNEEASKILKQYGKDEAILDIAKQIDAITKATRQTMTKDGLATEEEIKAWENTYKYYIPLKREGKGSELPKKGQGMYVGGKESKMRLTGSEHLAPVNIVANIMAQHESTIIRAEKAKVGRAMLKLATEHPNKDFWVADAPELKPFLKQRVNDSRQLDLFTGLPSALSEVVYGKDILYKFTDNVLVTKIDGVEHTITFNEQNVHSQRIVKALKNLGADNSNAAINVLSKVNRFLAIVNTSANPEFIISNFARDIQTAGYNINDTEAKGVKAKIFKDVFKALQGIRHGVRGKYDTEWAKYYESFEKAGAQTGWIDYYKNIEAREKTLKKKLALLKGGNWSAVQRTFRDVFEFVSNENTAVENAIRLSTYKHLKELGLSDAKAASAAKNLTVNFNRRGDAGQALNALYLFFNASAQGSVRLMYAAAKSPTVRKMMLGTIGFAVMLDMLNRAIGGDDDDGEKRYDKVPPWVKEHNLVIMRPNGAYFKIPLPWGYNTLHVLGQVIGEAVDPSYKKSFSPITAAGRVGAAVLNSFNPLGSESTLMQVISPTIIDPFIQWIENKNFAGIPLKPEQNPFDVPKPEYQMFFRSARAPSKWIAKQLNDLTGGDVTKPGLVNISPEVFDLFIDTFTGGAGRFLDNTLTLPKTLTEKDVDVRRIPFVRRMYGEPSEFALRTKFYDNLNDIRYAEKSVKHHQNIRDFAGLKKTREANTTELRFMGAAKITKKYVDKMRDQIKSIEGSSLKKEIKETRIENLEQEIMRRINQFNKRFLNAKQKSK